MLEITLLGTGGTVPQPDRWLTSCLIRCSGTATLIDCGEGTQITLHKEGYSPKQIDTILLTHYHADHIAGLPGLLLTMAKSDRTEPVTIAGPKGLKEIMQGIFVIAPYIPFEVRMIEIENSDSELDLQGLKVTPFAVRHSVPCLGYSLRLNRSRRFDKERALANAVPMKFWGRLQKGYTIEEDGRVYTPELVLEDRERKGLHAVYATDTRPCPNLLEAATGADLLITEGMYGNPEKLEKAKKNKHMMMQEAAQLAKDCGAKRLWLTHYSPSEHTPEEYAEELLQLFPAAVISQDGQHIDLAFEDES